MEKKVDAHVFAGMQKDTAISKHKNEFLYDAMNIRFTPMEGNTMLSITNERGPKYKSTYVGKYVGHCVINDKLILFTVETCICLILAEYKDELVATRGQYYKEYKPSGESDDDIFKSFAQYEEVSPGVWEPVVPENPDSTHTYVYNEFKQDPVILRDFAQTIVAIDPNNLNDPEYLFIGELGLDQEHKLETLGVYENENVIKVYWVDGKNQARVININRVRHLIGENTYSNLDYYDTLNPVDFEFIGINTQFDFVSSLKLEEEVSVSRMSGTGFFSPGTIQYAFSYYNLYGQQSNLFYVTQLNYVSYKDRGASPEKSGMPVVFKIDISNVDVENFDYLRIYAIANTGGVERSLSARRVVDIKTSEAVLNNGVYTITYYDNGSAGDAIDYLELLYVGGEEIIPNTLATKDNVLFLGNYKMKRLEIPDDIATAIKNNNTISSRTIGYTNVESFGNKYYRHTHQLPSVKPGFKNREHYKFGIQFQHKTGKWSHPIDLGVHTFNDSTFSDYPKEVTVNNTSTLYMLAADLVCSGLTPEIQSKLEELGYKKARGVCVFPNFSERLVLTQGLLCPTVYNYKFRTDNSPYAVSSWFFRPSVPDFPTDQYLYDKEGNYLEYRHMYFLPSAQYRNSEVDGATGTYSKSVVDNKKSTNELEWYVDQSIVTMHSPEIEFEDYFSTSDARNYQLKIVGYTEFKSNLSALKIETSTPKAYGFSGPFSFNFNINNGKCLVSNAFWEDYVLGFFENQGSMTDGYTPLWDTHSGTYLDQSVAYITRYMVYPWQGMGSLNNDEQRSAEYGTATSILSKKIMSNLRFGDTSYLPSSSHISYNNTDPKLFNSKELSLIKIDDANNAYLDNITYYGNLDTIVQENMYSSIYCTLTNIGSGKYEPTNNLTDTLLPIQLVIGLDGMYTSDVLKTDLVMKRRAIRMAFKSSNHLVFALKTNTQGTNTILPRFSNVGSNAGTYGLNESTINRWFWEDLETTLDFETIDLSLNIAAEDITRCSNGYQYTVNNPSRDSNYYGIPLFGDNTYMFLNDGNTKVYIANVSGSHWVSGNSIEVTITITAYSTTTKYFHYPPTDTYYQGTTDNSVVSYTPTFTGKTLTVTQSQIVDDNPPEYPHLLIGELYREPAATDFSDKDPLWIPVSEPESLSNINDNSLTITLNQGDTWYQRYDCLKTYPFSDEYENQIVDIGSFQCETRVNIEGRYDDQRGNTDNLFIDNTNFNKINFGYTSKDNFFAYHILDERFKLDEFPNQITWTLDKWSTGEIDLWTNLTLANTLDMDGSKGEIVALRLFNDNILCFQDGAISQVLFNSRVQIPTTDGVPIEISNSGKMDGKRLISDTIGCSNKWSIMNTPNALYFLDGNSKKLYTFTDKLQTISDTHGFDHHFKSIEHFESEYTFYDPIRQDVYLVWDNQCLIWSELLGQFTSFMSYSSVPAMFSIDDKFYCIGFSYKWDDESGGYTQKDSYVNLYEMFAGSYNRFFGVYQPTYITFISNPEGSTDKIFTNLESRVDIFEEPIEPNGDWKTSWEGQKYKLFDPSNLRTNRFFDYIHVDNEYQNTNEVTIPSSPFKPAKHGPDYDSKKKFRNWRVDIPRDKASGNGLDRIRNTWTRIKLGLRPLLDPTVLSNEECDAYAEANSITNYNTLLYHEDPTLPESGLQGAYNTRTQHKAPLTEEQKEIQRQYSRTHLILHDLDVIYFV